MKVYINHDFKYEVEHLVKTFDTVEMVDQPADDVLVNTIEIGSTASVSATYVKTFREDLELTGDPIEDKRLLKRANARVLYDLLSDYFGKSSPWGTLIGVRPGKLVHSMLDAGLTPKQVDEMLYKDHRISASKRQLLLDVVMRERPYMADISEKNLSLYICIPFCPSRCLYCSFPSNDMKKKGRLVEAYLKCLHKEIEEAFKSIQAYDRHVDCIYIGGGTPSILSADQFHDLFERLGQYLDLSKLKEFTVEAGRPDTISEDKLRVLKRHHVTRICLNPQSMNDRTLSLIGRSHDTVAILSAYELIRKYDFDVVNMDLILGLPDEDLDDVKRTLELVVDMAPENITIHTLAVKTSSRLKEKLEEYNMTQAELVEAMLDLAQETMSIHGYQPYYMYRQKNMVGNFENVGYAKDGKESLYNIRIIEEMHDILALGAGAVSKQCFPEENRFQRIANIKGIEEYIERIDDVIKKQKTFFL